MRCCAQGAKPAADDGESGPRHRAVDGDPRRQDPAKTSSNACASSTERLKEHIVGQDEAIDAVSAAIRRNRVGISAQADSLCVFHLCRPHRRRQDRACQGACAASCLIRPKRSIRLDMSEFMEKHSVSRIIGSPPGYVGYDEAGQLTEKIRRKPYAVHPV